MELFSATMFSIEFSQSILLLTANGPWFLPWSILLGLHKNDNSLFTLCNESSKFSLFLQQMYATAKIIFLRLEEPTSSTRFLSVLMFSYLLRGRVVQATIFFKVYLATLSQNYAILSHIGHDSHVI